MHAVHDPLSGPEYPPLHLHAVTIVLWVRDELKEGQPEHTAKYVFARHGKHMLSEFETVFALAFPAAHSRHCPAALTPSRMVYLPVPQSQQSITSSPPLLSRNLPVGVCARHSTSRGQQRLGVLDTLTATDSPKDTGMQGAPHGHSETQYGAGPGVWWRRGLHSGRFFVNHSLYQLTS